MTNLEMYQIFAPFGPIAPRGATALLDKDREEEDKGIVHTPAYTLKNWKLWDGAVNRYGPPTTERERERVQEHQLNALFLWLLHRRLESMPSALIALESIRSSVHRYRTLQGSSQR